MFAKTMISGLTVSAVAISALALTAGPAAAAVDPDDTTFAPVATDLIGVGSDTSQNALFRLANAYNAQAPAPTNKIATYAATGGGTIDLPVTDITRPNGSGAGKTLLYGGIGNVGNTEIDFARSSSAQSTAETNAGLQSFPFALDTLVMAVSASTPSNAPATLTPSQIVEIYKGNTTNWNQIGGSSGFIEPKIPQTGSGTRSFFIAQLTAANSGVAFAPVGAEVQEHDDTLIKDNANAIAPFSEGRAKLLGTTLRLESGFRANRALYNVVRGLDVTNPDVQAIFGSNGFVCSAAAKPLIEAAGFKQLFPPAKGGVCGQPTQSATSNFVVDSVITTTAVTASVASASSARIVARVSGSTAPSGTYAFYEGATLLQSGVPLVSGQATRIQPAAPGAHTYRAVFTPAANSPFTTSEAAGSVSITGVPVTPAAKAVSTLKESFPKTVKAGSRAKGTVTVSLKGIAKKATGKIKIKKGTKTLVTRSLSGGKATVKLPQLKNGKNKLKIVWGGDAAGLPGKLVFTIKQITG